ncbi:TPA: helix-turn-helix domain-containing protein [Vibrio parahaemolyticus]
MLRSQVDKFVELISLTENFTSFFRFQGNSADYHHWHQCMECLYVENGSGVVIVDNRSYTMRPGRLFVFPPFTLHKVMVDETQAVPYGRTVLHIDVQAISSLKKQFPENMKQLAQLGSRHAPCVVFDLSEKHGLLMALFSHYETLFRTDRQSHEMGMILLLQLLNLLPNVSTEADCKQNDLSTRVMEWVDKNYRYKFSLDELALDLGYSNSYISRKFHQDTGSRIQHYLLTFRLRKACELLRKTLTPIEDIAALIGFSSTTYFISSFKKNVGDTPLKYRKRYNISPISDNKCNTHGKT